MVDLRTARRIWTLIEPVHAVSYFASQPRQAFEAVGLRGFWRGYFAGRSAPLGRVGPAPVVALFYGFAPAMVERALPSVWQLASPDVVLDARLEGATAALADLGGPVSSSHAAWRTPSPLFDGVREAAELARAAVEGAEAGGRALGAANAALPWPDDPLPALWHATTVLRELRGDGHVSALLTHELTGLDALVLRAASDLDRGILQTARGWTDAEWAAAEDELSARGLLAEGGLTRRGRDLLAGVEEITDRLAAQPWSRLGSARAERLAALIAPLSGAAADSMPALTPIGLPRPGPS